MLAHVQELQSRGDMMRGVLSMQELEQVPAALEQAAGWGEPAAWLALARWLAGPPAGSPGLRGMERALERARALAVPGADLETVRLRWLHRRQHWSLAEQADTYGLARQLVDRDPRDSRAWHYLGLLTCHGFGTQASPEDAVTAQRKAADLGDAEAMFELYVHHETGVGMAEVDQAQAFEWLVKAAERGHPWALYNMGACHATGRGVAKDPAMAATWYRRASEAGSARATAMLAVMHARGEGAPQDIGQARALLDEAEHLGCDVAPYRRLAGL